MMSRERVSENKKDRRALIVVCLCVIAALQVQILFSNEKATLAPETESKMVRTGSSLSGFHLYGDVSEEDIEDGIEAEGLEYSDSREDETYFGYPSTQYASEGKQLRDGISRKMDVFVSERNIVMIRNTYRYDSFRICYTGYEEVINLIKDKKNPFSHYEEISHELLQEYHGEDDILEVRVHCNHPEPELSVTLKLTTKATDSLLGKDLQAMYQSNLFPVMNITTIIDNHQEG